MKKMILIVALLMPTLSFGQAYNEYQDLRNGYFGTFVLDQNTGLPYIVSWCQQSWYIKSDTIKMDRIDSALYNDGTPTTIVWSRNGELRVSPLTAVTGKIPVTYSGTTNASGVYTVTFPTAYSTAPNIQANIVNQSATNQFIRISSVSATGFTVNVFQRNSVTILGIDVLLATTTNVNGAEVDVLITEK